MTLSFYEAAERHARAQNERIENCHLEVACPVCGASRGEKCVRKGTSPNDAVWAMRLKHPHRERWTQVVPSR